MSNLPEWSSASEVYRKAYRTLELMAQKGHATPGHGYYHGKHYIQTRQGTISEDMRDLIDALNEGDEARIKGLLLMTHIYPFAPSA